jgi:hypothetical protein
MKVERINWPYEVNEKLKKACGVDFVTIRNEVQDGVSHLYHFESELVDLMIVTRGEVTCNGKELVLVCIAGRGMKYAGQLLIDNALRLGFDSIRYHTNQSTHKAGGGLIFNAVEVERVYRVDLGDVKNGG